MNISFQKIAELIMTNSIQLNIELNARTETIGYTGFSLACGNGHSKIADMLLKNSDIFKINTDFSGVANKPNPRNKRTLWTPWPKPLFEQPSHWSNGV